LLFGYAVVVFIACLVVVLDRRNDIPVLKNLL
jgi:hypothetical protein